MKQIEVHIMGQSYILACTPETESTLRQAVARVDTAMCQIRDAGKLKARERIAVLAALNIAAQNISSPASPVASSGALAATSTDVDLNADLTAKISQALATHD